MSKKKRAIGVGRMTPATIAAIVAEIEAYGRGERTSPLTWKALREFSGFSQVSLWKKVSIKTAFANVQQAQRADATPIIKPSRTTDERIVSLQSENVALKEILRSYDDLWARYEYNAQRMGWDAEELRRPMDPLRREIVTNRRGLRSRK